MQTDLVFGANQGRDTYLLTGIRVVGVCSHGDLLVADWSEGVIHRFDRLASHLGEFGRKGSGPGEFGADFRALLYLDKVYTFDPFNLRVQQFTCDGQYLGQTRIPAGHDRYFAPYMDQGDDRYMGFAAFYAIVTGDGPHERTLTSHLQFSLFDEHLEPIQVVIDSTIVRTYPAVGMRTADPPFEIRWPRFALSGGRPLAWTWGDRFLFWIFKPTTGETTTVTMPDHAPRRLTEAIRDWQVEAWRFMHPVEEELARRIRVTEWPDHLPHIGRLVWDALGRLWVGDHAIYGLDEGPYEFRVFDEEGTWLFNQSLPAVPSYIAADGFYSVVQDGISDPTVQFYRLIERVDGER